MWWLTRTAQDQLSKADKIIIAVSRGHGSLGPFLEASRARAGAGVPFAGGCHGFMAPSMRATRSARQIGAHRLGFRVRWGERLCRVERFGSRHWPQPTPPRGRQYKARVPAPTQRPITRNRRPPAYSQRGVMRVVA